MLTMASGQQLVELSRLRNGRFPTAWHTELIENVAWCNTNTRTSPAQTNAVSTPVHD
ncbi:MAG: hypothetical protein JWN96_1392, partial [Mycobacterium sp.]|nr:hypothetical protein [Mycobacterium sp.]